MTRHAAIEGVTPLLVSAAVERTGESNIAGAYCSTRNVWMVEGPNGPEPIATSGAMLGSTTTLTEVKSERDDTDVEFASLANTTTNTAVSAETDDTDLECAALGNTTTFTRVQAEADDTDAVDAAMLEITTKTAAQVEHEDTPFTLDLLIPHETERRPGCLRIQ